MKGKHITINGKTIYVCVKGEGEPIIFLHGGPGGSHEYFLPHMEPLAEDYQIILYDQTGCGKSGGDSYSMEEEIHTLEGIRKELNLEKVSLFGESWGSILALSYATRYPSHIHKIILTAAIGLSSKDYVTFKKLFLQKLGPYKKVLLVYYSLFSVFRVDASYKLNKLLDPYYVFSVDTLKKKKEICYNNEALKSIGRDIEQNYNLFPFLSQIDSLPILIAQGSHDILAPAYIKENVIQHLRRAELVEVKECGHWTILEQPGQILKLARKFISDGKNR
ncbi:alpha/beta fold hydrolase [Rossellomorea sp. NPDC071047]|uniref:alpha/beta fold hydrolase n=1 Tax=Rossellomorea sp. NPDC071047 TaxID=3390675 RepID=UPI003CFBF45D